MFMRAGRRAPVRPCDVNRPINRLLMLRVRGFTGPLFQRISPRVQAHSAGNYIAVAGFQPLEVSDGGGGYVALEVSDDGGSYEPLYAR